MPDLAAVEQAGWHEAERRGAMLRALAAGRCRRNDAAAAAAALGLSTRQVYALVRRLRASGGLLTALLPRKPNGGRGRSRLAAAVEAIIGAVIGEVWLDRQQRSIADAALEVRRRCLAAGLKAPAPSTVYRRMVALDPEATVRRRRGYDAARVFAPVGPSSLVASRPLAVVQMDHTPVDLVIVDERHRRPIGRPYLTVAIDVYSRCVVGFCLTLDPPSSVSVGLCLTHAVLPKEAWLAERGVEASWPVLGLPAVLHVDNAPEFHGEALQRGCLQHGIELDHRPVARPHYGGIVERLIGSLMQLVHRLPGTTFSNPTERGSYPSEDKACLTLAELERWVTLAITGLHHRRLHSGIGTPPIVRWREGLARPPALPADPKRFLIDFLPVVRRRLRRQGVVVDAITYDDAAGHAYRGMTRRNRSLFLEHGHAYIYLAYGSSYMLNVSSEMPGIGAGVLIRALEPLEGIPIMQLNRGIERLRDLARGPGRLTVALRVDRWLDGLDLCREGPLWLGRGDHEPGEIGQSIRIGISRDANRLLRFYLRDSPFVSGPRSLKEEEIAIVALLLS